MRSLAGIILGYLDDYMVAYMKYVPVTLNGTNLWCNVHKSA